MNVNQIVEAVLFASDAPLTANEIARADEMLDEDQVQDALGQLAAEYDDGGRSFQVVELAEGYQILTRQEFAPYLERFDNVPRQSRLSAPALETLAIIAYRQPIGRLEVEYIRGVGASGVIRTLQDRRLIDVVGRSEGLGRPLLYGTTMHFLEHFGFRSLESLPRPEELPVVLRDRIPLGIEGESEPGEGAEDAQATLDMDGEGGVAAAAAAGDVEGEIDDESEIGDGGAGVAASDDVEGAAEDEELHVQFDDEISAESAAESRTDSSRAHEDADAPLDAPTSSDDSERVLFEEPFDDESPVATADEGASEYHDGDADDEIGDRSVAVRPDGGTSEG